VEIKKDNPSHIAFLLILIGFTLYSSAIFHPFVHDDVVFIQYNPHIKNLDLSSIFLNTMTPNQHSSIVNAYYRPILEIINRIQYKIFQLNPYGYHFTNILFHIFNSIIVYLLFMKIWPRCKELSIGIAIIFLIHPIQTEAVACISGNSNIFYAFFSLLSCFFYIASDNGQSRKINFFLYSLSLFLFIMALFTKEQSVILPFLIILYEVFISSNSQKTRFINRFLRISNYILVLVWYFLTRKIILGAAGAPSLVFDHETTLRLLTIPRTLLTYFQILFLPYDLHYYRSQDILQPFLLPTVIFIFIIGIIIWIVSVAQRTNKNTMLFGLGWFLISLLPALNIIPLVNEYSLILTAEHFLYIPMIGFFAFIFSIFRYYLDKRNEQIKRVHVISFGIVCLILGLTTLKQNTYWRGEVPLFERVVRYEKSFGRGRMLLAKAYYFNQEYEKAIDQDIQASKIMQNYVDRVEDREVKRIYLGFMKGIHFDLANSYEALGRMEDVIHHYKQGLLIDPYDGVLQNNLGVAFLKTDNINEALKYFNAALELDQNNLMAMNNLAYCYLKKGDEEKAEVILKRILKKDPQSTTAMDNLNKLLQEKIKSKQGMN